MKAYELPVQKINSIVAESIDEFMKERDKAWVAIVCREIDKRNTYWQNYVQRNMGTTPISEQSLEVMAQISLWLERRQNQPIIGITNTLAREIVTLLREVSGVTAKVKHSMAEHGQDDDKPTLCKTCNSTGVVFSSSGEGPWDCFSCDTKGTANSVSISQVASALVATGNIQCIEAVVFTLLKQLGEEHG